MAHLLIMPRQGNTVESCIIVDWKVKEGDAVGAETPVCDVETDKATFEVPAGAGGTILKILHPAGDDVPVLEPIAVIGEAGEDWQNVLGKGEGGSLPLAPAAAEAASSATPSAGLRPATPRWGDESPQTPRSQAASPRARGLAAKEALPLDGVPGTGPGGRIIERDVAAALADRPPLSAAAKAAGPGAVPPAGSGIGGRVLSADLAAVTTLPGPSDEYTDTPIKGIRKLIADRMYQSLAESAQFTLNAQAPVTRLQELRSRMKSGGEAWGLEKITVNDLILFAVSRLLPRYPFMNAHKIGDTLRSFNRVHLGVAVDTPRGLMVPVIRNADLLSLARISAEAKRLAAACQGGSVKPEELSGSTFTVTNLGSLGISAFTPVLNAPEVGILGVCGIDLKPVAAPPGETCGCGGKDEAVRFEPHIGFSLTINHQVVDGAPAARFLKALGEAVADIDLLLAAG
jgi:pyruvate dehydrogenase E2 component (dihydrolipoamide acetyltransferase)